MLSLRFADALPASEVGATVLEIEHQVRCVHPAVVALLVKPQTSRTYHEAVRRRFGVPVSDAASDPPANN